MHLPTLIILVLLINLMIGLHLLALFNRKPKDRCFLYWALSCFSFVLGGGIASLRTYHLPQVLTYFAADFLLILAPVLVCLGLVQFSRFRFTKSKRRWAMWLLLGNSLLLLLIYRFPAVVSLYSALVVSALFWLCASLLKHSVFNEPVYTRLLRAVFIAHSGIMVMQSVLYGVPWFVEGFSELPVYSTYTLLSHAMLTTLTALVLPWLSFLKLERRLTLKSQRDGLTNLFNRSHFFSQVQKRWEQEPDQPVVLMMIDVDHFKSVNDQYGHSRGDQVLKDVASVFSKSLRSHDIIGRVGGEEFAALIPNERLPKSEKIAQRLQQQVRDKIYKFDGHEVALTVSIGLVEALPRVDSLQQAFDAADKALYESKHAGRDTYTVAAIG